MKFETERIHFLSDVLICCHPQILLPWQRDVTTCPLYVPLFCSMHPRVSVEGLKGPDE